MGSKRKRRANAKKRSLASKRSAKRKKGVQIGSKEVFNIYG